MSIDYDKKLGVRFPRFTWERGILFFNYEVGSENAKVFRV